MMIHVSSFLNARRLAVNGPLPVRPESRGPYKAERERIKKATQPRCLCSSRYRLSPTFFLLDTLSIARAAMWNLSGKESYRGSGKLTGKRAVITGVDGGF